MILRCPRSPCSSRSLGLSCNQQAVLRVRACRGRFVRSTTIAQQQQQQQQQRRGSRGSQTTEDYPQHRGNYQSAPRPSEWRQEYAGPPNEPPRPPPSKDCCRLQSQVQESLVMQEGFRRLWLLHCIGHNMNNACRLLYNTEGLLLVSCLLSMSSKAQYEHRGWTAHILSACTSVLLFCPSVACCMSRCIQHLTFHRHLCGLIGHSKCINVIQCL